MFVMKVLAKKLTNCWETQEIRTPASIKDTFKNALIEAIFLAFRVYSTYPRAHKILLPTFWGWHARKFRQRNKQETSK